VKRPKVMWLLLVIFIGLSIAWIKSDEYPYPIYEYRQTGEVIEMAPMDRRSGLEVEAIPIWIPDNPLWVDIIRRIAPLGVSVLVLALIALEVNFRDRRHYEAILNNPI